MRLLLSVVYSTSQMIKYVTKDITTVERGIVAHGVNCQGAMGSGVALAIKTKWPAIYEQYMRLGADNDLLGSCTMVAIEHNELYVANCYTQLYYGVNGRFADPEAIRKSLASVFSMANLMAIPVYLPKIGAGLGGLDWDTEVAPIVEELSNRYSNVNTYICLWD